ncbi:Signal transduction histidine kinase [Daejeonella rubra]|uniref:histidine kinase n=1 Tax=Daejeonella rubra TaxID=990371 RepID=A0A1G9VKU4_9SPHI|nr:7TM diverse intracellular signaling domain-containing protein [Daejeonella rubra]SDM72878.1 Signal transduction histidine kinase [Daejeonella rubra]
MRKFASLIFIFFISYSALASDIYILEDKARNLNSKQVQQLFLAGKFSRLPERNFNPGFTKSVFWLAIRANANDSNQKLIIGNAHINRLHFYISTSSGSVLKYTTGDYFPFKQRPIIHHLFNFPLEGKVGDLYLLRVDKNGESLQLHAEILPNVLFYQKTMNENLITGLLWGIIVLVIVFGCFLYITVREKLYLYYVLYIITGSLWIIADKGYGYQYLWPDFPDFASRARPIFTSLSSLMLLQFMQVFIGQGKESRFYKPIWIAKVGLLLIAILFIFLPIEAKTNGFLFLGILSLAGLSTQILIALSLVEKIRQKNPQAWYYLFSISALITFSITELLVHSGGSGPQLNYLSNYGIQTGLVIEVIILNFGLANRFNAYKNEKEILLLEVNKKQKELTDRIIETQELERKKIADQLHDDISSLLSLASLQVSSVLDNINSETSVLKLKKAGKVLDSVSQTVRNISHTLTPLAIEKYGFKNAITDLIEGINSAEKIRVEHIMIGFDNAEKSFLTMQNDIYRIIKELLNNIIKHSGASHCLLQLVEDEDRISIMVEDNGIGMQGNTRIKNGIGLANITAKINYFQGLIEISKKTEGGLMINIEIPIKTN